MLDSYGLVVDAAQFAMMGVVVVTAGYIAVSAAEKIVSIAVVVVVPVIGKIFAVADVLVVKLADNFAFFYADADLLDDFRLTDVFVAAEFAAANCASTWEANKVLAQLLERWPDWCSRPELAQHCTPIGATLIL